MAHVAEIHIQGAAQVHTRLFGEISLWNEIEMERDGVMITHARAIEILSSVETKCRIKSLLTYPIVAIPLSFTPLVGSLILWRIVLVSALFLIESFLLPGAVGGVVALIFLLGVTVGGLYFFHNGPFTLFAQALFWGVGDGEFSRASLNYAAVMREARLLREGLDPNVRAQAVFVLG